MNNSLTTIRPYKYNNVQWVFDDSSTGLNKEAFVAGVDTTLDQISKELNIDPEKGLTCTFAGVRFPGCNLVLKHMQPDEFHVGNWYQAVESSFKVKGFQMWFCPALLLYFKNPPKYIYGKLAK